ncbi:MAG: acetyl-CoA carboxylase carboxyltransferase subunit alpha [Lentisphaeraceae bacterium]|nr:acetyl-CoA carboxylase carboxyltransferase subunit alpha [Lentisphaeraceae bacterium]
MENFTLEFEKPLQELQEKIVKMEAFSKENNVDMTGQIAELNKQLEDQKVDIFENLSPWQRVSLARHPKRPYSLDYIERITTDFMELKGDRLYGNDEAIIGGFAKLDGEPIMILAHQKGRDLQERNKRNFGMAHPEGYRKALRLMRLAEKARTPILCIIDTPGAYPGIASEERHVGEAIAVNLREMFKITVPIVCIVIGEGGSGGALGIGIGNKVMIMENAYYSVISPEGCAGIIWKDGTRAAEAAEAMKITAKHLMELNVVDSVIKEPVGGAHKDHDESAKLLKAALLQQLDDLSKLSNEEILNQRYERFRSLGEIG